MGYFTISTLLKSHTCRYYVKAFGYTVMYIYVATKNVGSTKINLM